MSVSFDGRISATTSTTQVFETGFVERVPAGAASSTSTMQSYEKPVGLCAWIGRKVTEFWQWIKSWFASAEQREESKTPLERRLKRANDLLTHHCQQTLPADFEWFRTAVVVVMRYNNQTSVNFCRLADEMSDRRMRDGAPRQLQELLTNEANCNCENGILTIETLAFEKNPDNTFNYFHFDSRETFQASGNGAGSGTANHIGRANVYAHLTRAIPPVAERLRVTDFVINQL